MRESQIVAYLRGFVRQHCGEMRKAKWEGRVGAPDWRVFLPGYCCWVETKRPRGGELSPAQKSEIAMLRKYGENVHILNSTDAIDYFFMLYAVGPEDQYVRLKGLHNSMPKTHVPLVIVEDLILTGDNKEDLEP